MSPVASQSTSNSMPFRVGQKVKLISTGEVGIIVWLWTDPETGDEDAYVAFFGQRFPENLPENKPYILRYFTSSLEEVKEG